MAPNHNCAESAKKAFQETVRYCLAKMWAVVFDLFNDHDGKQSSAAKRLLSIQESGLHADQYLGLADWHFLVILERLHADAKFEVPLIDAVSSIIADDLERCGLKLRWTWVYSKGGMYNLIYFYPS